MARIILAALLLALTVSAGPAVAKDLTGALLVCGADRCKELHGSGLKYASTLTSLPVSAPERAAPFFEIVPVRKDALGRSYIDGTMRYVPSARAVRTLTGSGVPVWSRTDWMLTGYLRNATDGLRPRPASALDDGPTAVGRATLAVKRELAGTGSPSSKAGHSYRDLIGSAVLALLAVGVAAVMWRRSRLFASAPRRAPDGARSP